MLNFRGTLNLTVQTGSGFDLSLKCGAGIGSDLSGNTYLDPTKTPGSGSTTLFETLFTTHAVSTDACQKSI